MTVATTALDRLRPALDGDLVLPGDPRWDEARSAWNLAAELSPAAVVLAASAADVAAAVRAAADAGLGARVHGTGHNAAVAGGLEDVVLIKTERMAGVSIDPAGRRARVQAGAVWKDVAVPAARHGLAPLSGSSPDVGVAGFTLGGGIGWLSRRHGLAASSVRAIEAVLADGAFVRVDAGSDPDLFWGLRGGGGNLAAVTALEIDLHPAESVYAGMLLWPIEDAARVWHAWRELTPTAPDELTTWGRLLRFPPLPEIPEPMRGRAFAGVIAAHLGGQGAGAAALAPLRALGPEIDTLAPVAPDALVHLNMDPEEPVPALGDHLLLDDLAPETVDALLAAAGPGVDSPLVSIEVRHLGGALARPAPGGGALDRIEQPYVAFAIGALPDPALAPVVTEHLAGLRRALSPWASARSYLNFAEQPIAAGSAWSPAAGERLAELKRRYDPRGVLRPNHGIAAS